MHSQTKRLSVPTERQEARALMKWAQLKHIPLVHIPNEGKRTPLEGLNLLKAGLSPGLPDYLLPLAHGGYFGLFLELKQNREYRSSEMKTKTWRNQQAWLRKLTDEGYHARFVYGWEHAVKIIENYLALMPTLAHDGQL
jgi:hypothetical protein